MAEFAEKSLEDARPLCSIPLLLNGEEWQHWSPSPACPHHKRFRVLELQYLGKDYNEQEQQLDKLHEKTRHDVFVASFKLIEKKDGVILSWCVWSKGVVTWLPKTDYVGLYDPDIEAHNFVPWDRLQVAVGHIMTPLDGHPPRWLVNRFPSQDQKEQMDVEHWLE